MTLKSLVPALFVFALGGTALAKDAPAGDAKPAATDTAKPAKPKATKTTKTAPKKVAKAKKPAADKTDKDKH